LECFKTPPDIYRGTDFWMLNGELEDEELIRQIHEMKDKGVFSFIARTYIGLKSDYPGHRFKEKMKVIINTARDCGMKVFLQAGYMPEAVLGLPEDTALCYIKPGISGSGSENEVLLAEYRNCKFSLFNSETALDMFNARSVDFYLKQCYEDMWAEFSGEYGKTVLSVWVDEPSYRSEYLPYPRGIEEKFSQKWGYSLQREIPGLFFDISGYKTVRFHYWKLLQELMEQSYFQRLQNWCNSRGLLFSGHLMHEDSLQDQISRACAIMPYYKYFDIPGIDCLTAQMNWCHNEIKPGEDEYFYRRAITNTPIQCTSAARQAGREHVLCEMYGVSTQNLTFRDQRHMFDHFASYGVNHRCIHGLFYSLHGRCKRAYPPHISYYQPYWKDYKRMADYVARVSRFISLGKPQGDILVVHPLETAYMSYSGKINGCPAEASSQNLIVLDKHFHDLMVSLTAKMYVFDLGDERTIEMWGEITADNRFKVGQMTYSTVVLPYLSVLQTSTLDLIKKFAEQNGEIIVLGKAPDMLDGYEKHKSILTDIKNIKFAEDIHILNKILSSHDYGYRFSGEKDELFVSISKRNDGEKDYYYVFNNDCSSAHKGELTIKGIVRAIQWNAFDGTGKELPCRCENGQTVIPVTIEEGGSLLMTTETASVGNFNTNEDVPYTVKRLGDKWNIARNSPNVLLLEYCRFRRGRSDFSPLYPVLAVQEILVYENYRGELTLQFVFESDISISGLQLAIEDPMEQVVTLNGMEISNNPKGRYYLAKSFEVLDLPEIRAGENIIEIKREFVPLSRAKSPITSLFEHQHGVELESVYIIGNFSVIADTEPINTGILRYNKNFVIRDEKKEVFGELTKNGYPFFAGTISLTKSFCYSKYKSDRAVLKLGALNGCTCGVAVNGNDCGLLCWAPYEADISSVLNDGENTVTLTVTNTLRNLLGPYHRPNGETGNLFGGDYEYPNLVWTGATFENPQSDWYDHRELDTCTWTDSYLLVPLGVEDAEIRIYHESFMNRKALG